jgi:thioredoxin 1
MQRSKNVEAIKRDSDFEAEVIRSDLPVMVEFDAAWCGPCREFDPIVDKIADDYHGRVKVVSVDIDNCDELTREYGVKCVPTVLVFKAGQKVNQSVGVSSREHLLQLLAL